MQLWRGSPEPGEDAAMYLLRLFSLRPIPFLFDIAS